MILSVLFMIDPRLKDLLNNGDEVEDKIVSMSGELIEDLQVFLDTKKKKEEIVLPGILKAWVESYVPSALGLSELESKLSDIECSVFRDGTIRVLLKPKAIIHEENTSVH